jgi:hypothetical protein
MAFKPAIAVFDACILYPFHLRNILVQAATDHLACSACNAGAGAFGRPVKPAKEFGINNEDFAAGFREFSAVAKK